MIGSVYVEPSEDQKSRTFRFSFCLGSQDCDDESVVFEQIEGFVELIQGEDAGDDSDVATEGAIRLFFVFFFFFFFFPSFFPPFSLLFFSFLTPFLFL